MTSKTIDVLQQEIISLTTRLRERDELIDHIGAMISAINSPNQTPAAPEAPRQDPTYYRVVTPRVVVDGEPTEWWPACILYTKKQLDALTEPYKIEERLYTAPLSPDHSGGGVGMVLPEGWKLVPIEPTREMLNRTPMHPDLARSLYSALLADSPSFDKVKELNQ